MSGKPTCERCGKKPACKSKRWPTLCHGCIFRCEISRLGQAAQREPEPTMAELDAMIAEQMKPENLPDWWDAETRRMRARGKQ